MDTLPIPAVPPDKLYVDSFRQYLVRHDHRGPYYRFLEGKAFEIYKAQELVDQIIVSNTTTVAAVGKAIEQVRAKADQLQKPSSIL